MASPWAQLTHVDTVLGGCGKGHSSLDLGEQWLTQEVGHLFIDILEGFAWITT
jgi:hypothetical protein